MAVPENIYPEQMDSLPPQYCEDCGSNGHRVRAVERVDGVYLCLYCRDGDPCPECKKLGKDAKKNGHGKVTLKQIVDEFQKVKGVAVRYPTEDEITVRFRRRSRTDMLDELVQLAIASPTGHAEFPVPPGMKAHSFQSLLARHLKAKKLRYTAHCDTKKGTVVLSNGAIYRSL